MTQTNGLRFWKTHSYSQITGNFGAIMPRPLIVQIKILMQIENEAIQTLRHIIKC